MVEIIYSNESLTKEQLGKNRLAVKTLEALGFTVVSCRIGGDDEFGGEIVYFTASSLPIEWRSEIEVSD